MASSYVEAANELLAGLVACIDEALGPEAVPAHRAVIMCDACIVPGCCDHLIAKVIPDIDNDGCMATRWTVEIIFGTCVPSCTEGVATKDLPAYYTGQLEAARQIERMLEVLLACRCDCGAPTDLRMLPCKGGCGGFTLTYSVFPVVIPDDEP